MVTRKISTNLRYLIYIVVLLLALVPFATSASPADPLINEFVANHVDVDTDEYIEIFGDPNTDYSNYWIVEIEGDASNNPGKINYTTFPLGTTDASGYFVHETDHEVRQLQNGMMTLLLVEGFTGIPGVDDIDTDDDGVIDTVFWARIVDDVATTGLGSAGYNYSSSVLPAYGGASRIPNGMDTDTTADWVVNDFDGAGILTTAYNSMSAGEAFNTPGYANEHIPTPEEFAGKFVINEIDGALAAGESGQFFELLNRTGADIPAQHYFGGGFFKRYVLLVYRDPANPDEWWLGDSSDFFAPGDHWVYCFNPADATNCDTASYPGFDPLPPVQIAIAIQTYYGSYSTIPLHVVQYTGEDGANVQESYSRCPDGDGDFVVKPGSPGSANACIAENLPPVAAVGGPYTTYEGDLFQLDGSGSYDPDGDYPLDFRWDTNYDGVNFNYGPPYQPSVFTGVIRISGVRQIALKVRDQDGLWSNISATSLAILNSAPTIDFVNAPSDPIILSGQENAAVNVGFTDPADWYDAPYMCDFDLDNDGQIEYSVEATYLTGTGGSCSATLNYQVPGVYSVKVTVTDKDGGSATKMSDGYIVVFDPAGGFVTGRGWFNSPAGALASSPAAEGRAEFGFVTKYNKANHNLIGRTEFSFRAGGIYFNSEAYSWMVVNQGGTNAQFKGEGVLNGALDPNGANYKFMIWATDGGTGGTDTFRIKIWWEAADGTEHVVYDNGVLQAIENGQIKIHQGD